MKTEFSRHELYAMGLPLGDGATRTENRRRIYGAGGGSGGGGGQRYDNLDKLYAIQAEQGQNLMDMANKNVYPAFESLMEDSKNTGSLANQEKAATSAASTSAASLGQAKANLADNMASMGVNPSDPRYASTAAKLEMDGAAQSAAAQTGARDKQQQLGFAKMKDMTAMGMGIGSDATSALNSAGGFASTGAQMQMNQASMDQNARSNVASLAGRMMFADGGEVKSESRFGVGGIKHFDRGGIVGAMGGIKPPAPPSAPPTRSTGAGFLNGASQGAIIGGNGIKGGALIEKAGELTGSGQVQAFGQGMRLGKDAKPATDAYNSAAQSTAEAANANALTSAANGASGSEIAGASSQYGVSAGGEQAAMLASQEAGMGTLASEGAGAALAGGTEAGMAAGALGAGSAVAAAVPWIGGAMLVGSALGLFKDGGAVNKKRLSVADGIKGGPVSGPGGPKDDLIPAMLSNGEFVMPVGVVELYGKEALERMRQEGLAHEKKLGIGSPA